MARPRTFDERIVIRQAAELFAAKFGPRTRPS